MEKEKEGKGEEKGKNKPNDYKVGEKTLKSL